MASKNSTILTGPGKSRYVESQLWHTLGDDEIQHMSDDDEDDEDDQFTSDPLTGAFIGSTQTLLHYHPDPTKALLLWKTHVENVEPICKLLHVPSTTKMVENVSMQPEMAQKAEECLLFATYHSAVFSLTDAECQQAFGQPQAALLQKYHFATRQALVNASFLKTTDIVILQAFVLLLLTCRYRYDSHTYWILTGVAVRIAQRMGLHRDGTKLGLPPFEVQMRRRLFYQLAPLDGVAGQMSGTGITIMPDTWDTLQPANSNDDQMWPGMTEAPVEQTGATDMIFCLVRQCLGKSFLRVMRSASSPHDYKEAKRLINEAENNVEEQYLRYCDVVDPLHFLTIALARSAISAMRLRIGLQTAATSDTLELIQIAQKILDTDAATSSHLGLRKFMWHVRPFFAWGTWDSIIFILTRLRKSETLPSVDAAWSRVSQIYSNHDELLTSKRALHIGVGRLAVKAWDTTPPTRNTPEPAFILQLRAQQLARDKGRATSVASPAECGGFLDGMDFGDTDAADWAFWDQLIHDHQVEH